MRTLPEEPMCCGAVSAWNQRARGRITLAACAFLGVGVGVLGVQYFSGSAPLPFETLAKADLVSQVGGLSVMTTDAGGEDLLLVLDTRNEDLFVYRTDLTKGVQLAQRYSLPQMFMEARARATGQ